MCESVLTVQWKANTVSVVLKCVHVPRSDIFVCVFVFCSCIQQSGSLCRKCLTYYYCCTTVLLMSHGNREKRRRREMLLLPFCYRSALYFTRTYPLEIFLVRCLNTHRNQTTDTLRRRPRTCSSSKCLRHYHQSKNMASSLFLSFFLYFCRSRTSNRPRPSTLLSLALSLSPSLSPRVCSIVERYLHRTHVCRTRLTQLRKT